MANDPIIIVGAARSGTHLLASLLEGHPDVVYLGEMNELWKKHVPVTRYDTIASSHATESTVRKTRRDFERVVCKRGGGRMLEKTPANVLRLPFVANVFPEARFIHIVRDGRDVAVSARRKYRGDTRKVTKIGGEEAKRSDKIKLIAKVARKKLRHGLHLGRLIKETPRYLNGVLVPLGLKQKAMWGPRFPGWEEYFNSYSLIELAAIQWQESVERSMNFFESCTDIDVYHTKYEDVTVNTERVLYEICEFVGIDGHSRVDGDKGGLVRRGKTWEEVLSVEEKRRVSYLIEHTLRTLDYGPTLVDE